MKTKVNLKYFVTDCCFLTSYILGSSYFSRITSNQFITYVCLVQWLCSVIQSYDPYNYSVVLYGNRRFLNKNKSGKLKRFWHGTGADVELVLVTVYTTSEFQQVVAHKFLSVIKCVFAFYKRLWEAITYTFKCKSFEL